MKLSPVTHHTQVVGALVDEYCNYNKIQIGRRVFDYLIDRKLGPWNAMIIGFAQTKHGRDVWMLFIGMEEDDAVTIMPSLGDVKVAISVVKSWLNNTKPILEFDFSFSFASWSLMKLRNLTKLGSQSRFLKIILEHQTAPETVLAKYGMTP